MNRRKFLQMTGGVLLAGSLGTLFRQLPVIAATSDKVLVVVIQRGAMDGLAAVTPYADPEIYNLRPKLALKAATREQEAAGNLLFKLDDRFGLHPALAALAPLYREGTLAVLHGVGSPAATRSHFEAQDLLETAVVGDRNATGWINRALTVGSYKGALAGIALTGHLPRILLGPRPVLALAGIDQFGLRTSSTEAAAIAEKYRGSSNKALREAAIEGFEAAPRVAQAAKIATTGAYPGSSFGRSLRQIGQLIRAEMGMTFAVAECGGWDNHTQEGAATGAFANAARDLGQSIAAFWSDLGPMQNRVILITLTEFGRTAFENGAGGTDHGRGSVAFVLGGGVKGGKVYGSIPQSLTRDSLEDKRDLPITTDVRALIRDVLIGPMGIADTGLILPGWSGGTGIFG